MRMDNVLRFSVWSCLSLAVIVPAFPQPAPPNPPTPPQPARRVVTRMAGGSYLGVGVAEIDSERAKALKLTEVSGVEVTRVEQESPASKAGLNVGDVIVEYNGQGVVGTEQFVRLVLETPVGRQVSMRVMRNGTPETLTATVASRRDAWAGHPSFNIRIPEFHVELPELPMPDVPKAFMSWRSVALGIEGEALESQLAEFFGVKDGVLVRAVLNNSTAERAGLKAGDVIVKVDGQNVSKPRDISRILRRKESKTSFPLEIIRNRQTVAINVTLEKESSGRGRAPRGRSVKTTRDSRL